MASPSLSRAEGMEGPWDTPYGRVKIVRDGDQLIGRLVEAGRVCSLKKDAEVLHGRLADELFTGELMVCYPCREEEWVLTLAMPLRLPERLLGSLGPMQRECPNSVMPKGFFTFIRPRAAPVLPTPEVRPAEALRPFKSEEAKSLYLDARAAMRGIDIDSPSTALKKLNRADHIEPNQPDVLEALAEAYRRQGNRAMAQQTYERLVKVDPIIGNYDLACLAAEDKNVQRALRYLNLAADKGFSRLDDMLMDKDLEPLRDDPEWLKIKTKVERNKRHSH